MGRKFDAEKLKLVRRALVRRKVSNVYRLAQETGIDSRTITLMLSRAKELGWKVDVFPERSFTVIWKGVPIRPMTNAVMDERTKTLTLLTKGKKAKSHSTAYKMGLSGRKTAYDSKR